MKSNWKAGPWMGYPTSQEMIFHAGRVALSWANIDQSITYFAATFLAVNGRKAIPGLERKGFKSKSRIVRNELPITFALHPTLVAAFVDLLDDADDLAWRRNVLLHGHLTGQIDPQGVHAILAHGTKPPDDEAVVLEFNLTEITQFAYQIDHVAAMLTRPEEIAARLPEVEKAALLEFLRANRRQFPE